MNKLHEEYQRILNIHSKCCEICHKIANKHMNIKNVTFVVFYLISTSSFGL